MRSASIRLYQVSSHYVTFGQVKQGYFRLGRLSMVREVKERLGQIRTFYVKSGHVRKD
jgi:hypothetical protein